MPYLVREDFDSISQLLKALNSRPNNEIMRNEYSSHTKDKDFTGTESYDEAIDLLYSGYKDPIPEIKKVLREQKKLMSKVYSSLPHPVPKNHVAGFVPNVPNSLLGLPQSMITVEKENQKRKTLSIIYAFGGSAFQEQEYFIQTGTSLVSAINIIETAGIQTELKLCFIPTEHCGEIFFPTVKIKSFGERFNLQKICFPMIHPSMFRRIGFRYLETTPLMTKDFTEGYGYVPSIDSIRELVTDKDTFVFNTGCIGDMDNPIEQILKEVKVL